MHAGSDELQAQIAKAKMYCAVATVLPEPTSRGGIGFSQPGLQKQVSSRNEAGLVASTGMSMQRLSMNRNWSRSTAEDRMHGGAAAAAASALKSC